MSQGRQRVIITRSLEPSIPSTQRNEVAAGQGTERHHPSNINNFLNHTLKQSTEDSIMSSFSPGRKNAKLHPPKTAGNINIQNHQRGNTISSWGTVDVRKKPIPDAMLRIKLKTSQIHDARNEKKK